MHKMNEIHLRVIHLILKTTGTIFYLYDHAFGL